MPRLARLDAPGVLHHVMARGIEKRKIFLNDADRKDFLERLAAIAADRVMDIYARAAGGVMWCWLGTSYPGLR